MIPLFPKSTLAVTLRSKIEFWWSAKTPLTSTWTLIGHSQPYPQFHFQYCLEYAHKSWLVSLTRWKSTWLALQQSLRWYLRIVRLLLFVFGNLVAIRPFYWVGNSFKAPNACTSSVSRFTNVVPASSRTEVACLALSSRSVSSQCFLSLTILSDIVLNRRQFSR